MSLAMSLSHAPLVYKRTPANSAMADRITMTTTA
jgi:hypothetical protein